MRETLFSHNHIYYCFGVMKKGFIADEFGFFVVLCEVNYRLEGKEIQKQERVWVKNEGEVSKESYLSEG